MNNVQIIGVSGRDTELKYTPSGSAVAETSLAIHKRWKDRKTGEDKETTDWIPVSAFGTTAEMMTEVGKKGVTLMVLGSLKVDQWEDKDTKKKVSKMKVVASRVYKIASTRTSDGEAPTPRPQREPIDPDPPESF